MEDVASFAVSLSALMAEHKKLLAELEREKAQRAQLEGSVAQLMRAAAALEDTMEPLSAPSTLSPPPAPRMNGSTTVPFRIRCDMCFDNVWDATFTSLSFGHCADVINRTYKATIASLQCGHGAYHLCNNCIDKPAQKCLWCTPPTLPQPPAPRMDLSQNIVFQIRCDMCFNITCRTFGTSFDYRLRGINAFYTQHGVRLKCGHRAHWLCNSCEPHQKCLWCAQQSAPPAPPRFDCYQVYSPRIFCDGCTTSSYKQALKQAYYQQIHEVTWASIKYGPKLECGHNAVWLCPDCRTVKKCKWCSAPDPAPQISSRALPPYQAQQLLTNVLHITNTTQYTVDISGIALQSQSSAIVPLAWFNLQPLTIIAKPPTPGPQFTLTSLIAPVLAQATTAPNSHPAKARPLSPPH
jgi:hypothetical protein